MSKRYLDYHGVTVLWTALKNYIVSVTPSIKKLTFTGGVTAEYDGTEDVTVNIPTGGSGGTTNYSNLSNKPKINNVELSGNKTTTQLGIDIPTKVSDLSNDSGFITTETDPTVPAWAKNSTKPTYTASEVGALPANYTPPVTSVNNQTGAVSLSIPTTQDIQAAITVNPYTIADSTPIATINGVEISAPTAGASTITTVQSDWNVTDTTSGAYIANKPTIPTATSDLTNDSGFLTAHQDISGKANIADLATVATSGNYNDLSNKPTIPAAVSVTNTLSSGTRVATINGTDVYAPTGGGNVEIEQVIESGTELAVINGTSIYAPSARFRFAVISISNVLTLQDDYLYIMSFWGRGIMPFITYNNEVYQPKAFGASDASVGGPGTMTFMNTSFDGTTYTYKQLVLTYDSSATNHCVVTYSTHSLQFNYTSATSTLDIVTA